MCEAGSIEKERFNILRIDVGSLVDLAGGYGFAAKGIWEPEGMGCRIG